MTHCDRCGKEIVFATIDGIVRPLHNCSANDINLFRRFDHQAHYCNPNAICPVCGQPVVYYQNAHGSRVFFNDFGVPWEKHGCTDNKLPVQAYSPENRRLSAVDRFGEELDFFQCIKVRGHYTEDGFRRTFFSVRIKSQKGFDNEFFCLGGQEGISWSGLSSARGFFRRVSDRSKNNFVMHFLDFEVDAFKRANFSRNVKLSERLRLIYGKQ